MITGWNRVGEKPVSDPVGVPPVPPRGPSLLPSADTRLRTPDLPTVHRSGEKDRVDYGRAIEH